MYFLTRCILIIDRNFVLVEDPKLKIIELIIKNKNVITVENIKILLIGNLV